MWLVLNNQSDYSYSTAFIIVLTLFDYNNLSMETFRGLAQTAASTSSKVKNGSLGDFFIWIFKKGGKNQKDVLPARDADATSVTSIQNVEQLNSNVSKTMR